MVGNDRALQSAPQGTESADPGGDDDRPDRALDLLRGGRPDLFGARGHRWHRVPATEARVAAFEQRHGVRLPDAFRRFLLKVTDSGLGPATPRRVKGPGSPPERAGFGCSGYFATSRSIAQCVDVQSSMRVPKQTEFE